MRPPSIRLFDKVFFASLALGILNTLLSWKLVASAADDPALKALGAAQQVVFVSVLLGLLLPLLLWYFIARRASNVAKWIFVVLTAFGLLGFLQAVANPLAPKSLAMVVSALALLLQIYAAWLLFKPDAKAWLDSRGADSKPSGPVV